MGSKYYKRCFQTLLALVLILPTFFTGFILPLRAEAVVTNSGDTISSGGNEVNEIVEHPGVGGSEPGDEELVDITDNHLE